VNNAVLYSIETLGESFEKSYRFRQLIYSVSRLRMFNPNIDVYVFVSSSDKSEINKNLYQSLKILWIKFDNTIHNDWTEDYLKTQNAKKLLHRWSNAKYLLDECLYDNILFVDTDTIFHNDPEILFTKYGNSDYLWTRKDNSYEVMNLLGVSNEGLNAGQWIISKNVGNTLDNLFSYVTSYINTNIEKFNQKISESLYSQMLWVIDQYAVYEYFNSIDRSVRYFDTLEVMLHLEPFINSTENLVLHHYLNSNYSIMVPIEFKNDVNFFKYLKESYERVY